MDRLYFEELSIRYLAGEATSTERQTLEQAIEQGGEFHLQFEELKMIWPASQVGVDQVDVDLAWHEISERRTFENPS
ncbi:MAG: hypothetical protein VX603_04370 [Gemmatimonadota bacterium]|nr:hypothetical protein [Gemmatimonadota bacterium]